MESSRPSFKKKARAPKAKADPAGELPLWVPPAPVYHGFSKAPAWQSGADCATAGAAEPADPEWVHPGVYREPLGQRPTVRGGGHASDRADAKTAWRSPGPGGGFGPARRAARKAPAVPRRQRQEAARRQEAGPSPPSWRLRSSPPPTTGSFSPGQHCHSTLTSTVIDYLSLGIYGVVLLPLLSFCAK